MRHSRPPIWALFIILVFAGAASGDSSAYLENYEKGDYKAGFKGLLELGNKKNAEAQYFVSRAYEHGLGVESDAKKMWDWLVKASDNGSGEAMHRIFYHYRFSGLCPEHENREKAAIWLEKAFEAGSPSAILTKAAFAEIDKSMSKGEIAALYKKALNGLLSQEQTPMNLDRLSQVLSIYYSEHTPDVSEDEVNKWMQYGVSYFEKHFSYNHPRALYEQAFVFLDDNNDVYNPEKGLECYKKAAAGGELSAILSIISAYERGFFAKYYNPDNRDLKKSFEMATIGADKNLTYAIYQLGMKYYKGQGVTKNKQKAISLMKRAKESGLDDLFTKRYLKDLKE